MFDVIIIGAGPAGLTAAIYAARRMMKALVISKNIGGQVIWASEIMNYPGIKSITGPELINNLANQVKQAGVEIKSAEASKIIRQTDNSFTVETAKESFTAKTLIITMGLAPKCLNLANEKELTGKGISYCANCDGPFFKGKAVAVVGGGNAALDAAEVMSKIAKKVYLVYRRAKFKGFEVLAEKVKQQSNIEIMLEHEISEISGGQKLEKLKVLDLAKQTTAEISVDGLFIEIGHEPKTDLVASLVERDAKGQIVVDLNAKTSADGVFAGGDVTASEFKQIVIGCGQGAIAALSAYKYLQEKK